MARIALVLCLLAGWWSVAAAQNPPKPIVIVGLRPAKSSVDGKSDIRRLSEAQRLRRVLNDVVRDAAQRPIIDDNSLRSLVGLDYMVNFMDCRSQATCVSRVVGKLKKSVPWAVYGDYAVNQKTYSFRIRLISVATGKVIRQVEFKLDDADREDRKLWRGEIEPLVSDLPVDATTGGGTAGGGTTGGGTTGGGTTGGGTTGGGSEVEGGGTGTGGTAEGGGEQTPEGGGDTGLPELAPITTEDLGGAASGTGGGGEFIDTSTLDAISRGITWHGHFQSYTAAGIRGSFKKDVVTFQERAQLEFENDINQVRSVGKPQLIYDVLTNDLYFQFREIYIARDYKKFDISVGEQIVTWGITDFWPVVDIVNPRDFSVLRQWRPIDEKIPVPSMQAHLLLSPLTFHLIAIPIMPNGSYQLDQSKPFALAVPAPMGSEIVQAPRRRAILGNFSGGMRTDLAIGAWKLSAYGLVGNDVLPAVHATLDPTMMTPPQIVVDNDRVVMGAMSLQGNSSLLDAIIKTEGAFYHRLNDDCEDTVVFPDGTPQCFYLHRIPTARMNFAIEKHVMTGLDAHLQLIGEYTRPKDIPKLPAIVGMVAPGLPEQYKLAKIATLRLQGEFKKGDFRPMAFFFWNYDDEAFFANLDLEYHLADGFALSLGGLWFEGYTKKDGKTKYTFVGSLETSSNVYLRATAWF